MLQGKGMFIWQVEKCNQGDAESLVALARAAQLTHVIFKLADGQFDFPRPANDPGGKLELLTDTAIRAFQQAGLTVWALIHTQGEDPEFEAHAVARRILKWKLNGVVVGPQQHYIGRPDAATTFMTTLKDDIGPDRTVAFSLYRDPDSQDRSDMPAENRFPVDEFAIHADLLMPQVYWVARDGGDPAGALRENYRQYMQRYPDKPYIPIGASFGEQYGTLSWSATPQQITLFLNQVRALNLSAVNFWSWQHARHDTRNPHYNGTQLWDAIAEYPWPIEGFDHGTPTTDPVDHSDHSLRIVAPGDVGYLDGVYGRFNTIRFSSMPGEYGLVKYASAHPTRSTLWAQWVPGVTAAGRYDIGVWVPSTHATTKRARYHIRGVSGQASSIMVEVDQSRYFDEFVSLGVFDLDDTRQDAGAVNLTNLTGETGLEIAFGPVRWKLMASVPTADVADGFDAPVGTRQERASNQVWPGKWLAALAFGDQYADGSGGLAYHPGVDLNLNTPLWDADRGAPVYSIAQGVVVFGGRKDVWGQIIVIRHDPIDVEGNPIWARYAHVDQQTVQVGDRVQRGQVIAQIGKPEPDDAPFHLHFDLCSSGIVETEPDYWPQIDYEALIEHFVDPRDYIAANRPQGD